MTQNTKHQNPLRKAFKRTFLRDVSASVTFAETDLLSNVEALRHYLKNKFHITDDLNNPKLSAIDIVSENRYANFHFTTSSASVTVASPLYRFYEESLEPRLDDIISFLKAIGISKAETFTLIKRNVFPGTTSNAFDVWKSAIVDTFREEKIRELAISAGSQKQPFKMSVEARGVADWGELRVPFSVDVPDVNNFSFHLDLIATSRSVMIDDLMRVGAEMNGEMFQAFTEIVSDKLLELLKKEG